MMTRQLIKLTPLDSFFFSQENKYRKKLITKDDGKTETVIEADYYQKSILFPQQTTILGMLRYYILYRNDQIPITDTELAKKLVGKTSFKMDRKDAEFGTIGNISSVFIIDQENRFYYKNPKDLLLKDGKVIPIIKTNVDIKSSTSKDMVFFENYSEKDGLDNFLINSYEDVLPLNFDKENAPKGVFIMKEQVGITKEETEDAYYKQVSYTLNKGYSFGIIAEIEGIDIHTGFVSMGTEKNPFKISFESYTDDLEKELLLKNDNSPKIVLLSDAYLSDYNTEDFQFAILDTITFRFLKTKIKEGNKYYSSDPLKEHGIKRSEKFNLIERGSVFFFKDEKQMNNFSSKLNSETNFTQIGYNQHKKVI